MSKLTQTVELTANFLIIVVAVLLVIVVAVLLAGVIVQKYFFDKADSNQPSRVQSTVGSKINFPGEN